MKRYKTEAEIWDYARKNYRVVKRFTNDNYYFEERCFFFWYETIYLSKLDHVLIEKAFKISKEKLNPIVEESRIVWP